MIKVINIKKFQVFQKSKTQFFDGQRNENATSYDMIDKSVFFGFRFKFGFGLRFGFGLELRLGFVFGFKSG